jgi:ring-1,2-phenylacetyl-CoA epoxidase subunit PaaC
MTAGLADVWPLVDELFTPHPIELGLPGTAADVRALRGEFDTVLDTVLAAATLDRPQAVPLAGLGGRTGRDGLHTEDLGYLLAEMQSVARALPGSTW